MNTVLSQHFHENHQVGLIQVNLPLYGMSALANNLKIQMGDSDTWFQAQTLGQNLNFTLFILLYTPDILHLLRSAFTLFW